MLTMAESVWLAELLLSADVEAVAASASVTDAAARRLDFLMVRKCVKSPARSSHMTNGPESVRHAPARLQPAPNESSN